MNKILIPIIVALIITAGIGIFFVSQKPVFPEPLTPIDKLSKCGDGICDEVEKKNSNLCPEDCEKQTITQPVQPSQPTQSSRPNGQIDQDSPFGIFGPYVTLLDNPNLISKSEINSYLEDLGVKWVQEMPRGNDLDEVAKSGANVYSRALPIFGTPEIPDKYKTYLSNLIKQYKDRIKYWEVDTEPSGFPPPIGWKGYPKEYAAFLKATYEVVKKECRECKVVFGGLPGDFKKLTEDSYQVKFLKEVLQAGGAKYFDVFEFKHHHTTGDYMEIKNKMKLYGNVLSQYEIDIQEMPVFIETAMYDGSPQDPFRGSFPNQSESEQAASLVNTYIFGITQGIDKIFWNLVVERGPKERKNGVFQNYGLINNPDNDGLSHKKLSYYTYKKLVEVLEGSDWDNIQTVQEKDGVYVYKFTKNGKQIWVAWNDNSAEKIVEITGIGSKEVKITEAVPKYNSGKDVTDYNTAFNTETKAAQNGRITITLKDKPVFVEE